MQERLHSQKVRSFKQGCRYVEWFPVISILAEIIQIQTSLPAIAGFIEHNETGEEQGKQKFYINPVCGVPVEIKNPKHVIDYKGELVYFCCDGCKVKFEIDPKKYMEKEMV